ncbi:hypothetical protein [Pseudomonas sp.]|uniref:hypothetical protein n=1 Tax=Pseudomonas sp. TaxID=306 RepID=UPI003266C378
MKSEKEMVVIAPLDLPNSRDQKPTMADLKKVSPGAPIRNFDSGPAVPSRDWRYHQHVDPNLMEPFR